MPEDKIKVKITIEGISDYDEQRNLQCSLLKTLLLLGYNCNSENFEVMYE